MNTNCIITVKGDGRGQYGHPKYDRTGPIESFIVDNVVFYSAVFQHVKTCPKCSPLEIMTHYFQRRKGLFTETLINLLKRYYNLIKKSGSAADQITAQAMINEATIRSAYNEYEHLNDYDVVRKIRFEKEYANYRYRSRMVASAAENRYYQLARLIVEPNLDKTKDFSIENLPKLLEISSVMSS